MGEQKPLGKTPKRGNPSPESTYLPTSSVLNPSHLPLLYRWEGEGELVQLQLPSATFGFFAQAKTGADHRINKLHLSQEWRGQADLFTIHAVHAT